MPKKPYLETPIGTAELACVYASLILADDEIPITGEKITTILNAAEVQVDSIWPSMFAKALTGVSVRTLISGVSGGFGGAGAGAGAAAGPAVEVVEEEKKEEKPEEPEEDSEDEDFGLSLFD